PLSTAPAPPPAFAGVPLKYISLVTLAVQNAALAVLMHYSRISAQPSRAYSAAAAVLATELLKGAISLAIAFTRVDVPYSRVPDATSRLVRSPLYPPTFLARCRVLGKEVFRPDCWKLSIPAILYVIQNNLQFVAASNLDAATFQVTYQMKILTTAAFSVLLLRKKLTSLKWFALIFLAVGVAIVQLQASGSSSHGGNAESSMVPFKGFLAVVAACFTSGLAGVYFEMVLKNSSGDLWIRNVQLSLFSLLPALAPIVLSGQRPAGRIVVPSFTNLFANFTVAAWATVATQVLGGLVTALVIKYADNIMKGFATSLSIVLSFLLSVALFNIRITLTFLVGATVVLVATWLYSQPDS
ncbi:nucleotide-sugar transporter, partial [Vararia minispora EC-137]